MGETQRRVFMWAIPRSTSTAFFRAMLNRPDTMALLEPFAAAYHHGVERVGPHHLHEPFRENSSYAERQALCEQEYPGYGTVFVKDMPYFHVGRLNTVDDLPKGYIHTFLIRNPRKTVPSMFKMSFNKETGWNELDPVSVRFDETYQVYKLVTEELGQEAIILDSDDLLDNPELMLRAYCAKVGIAFSEKMLHWKDISSPDNVDVFGKFPAGWYENLNSSNAFNRLRRDEPLPELTEEMEKIVEDNMPMYSLLHAKRIKPNECATR